MVGGRDGDELGVHLGQGPRLRMVRIAHGDQVVPARVGEQPLDGLRRRVQVLQRRLAMRVNNIVSLALQYSTMEISG
jgi:hypothetical protein